MRNRGITFKLFIITVIVFACFYGMVMLSQLLFFNQFYETYKMKQVERNVQQLADSYVTESQDSHLLARNAIRFMERNKSQLAIVDLNGNFMLNDTYQLSINETYHLVLQQADGKELFVPLSLMISTYGGELRRAGIKVGDQLTIDGTVQQPSGNQPYTLLAPEQIRKTGIPTIGENLDSTLVERTGKVKELVVPDMTSWRLSQGLLMQAIYEEFPLSASQKNSLRQMQELQFGWSDSWSGANNLITMHPLEKNGKLQIVFVLTSIQEISDTNEALRWFYLYLGIGGFILLLILSLFFSRMVTRPLITLNEMAKRMVKLDFRNVAPPLRQQDELGGLARSMHTMSHNLDQALQELQGANQQLQQDMERKQRLEQMQQSFFANASHELKTPLSIIKSFAEGLQDGVNVSKTGHYVNVIVEEADKMEMLIKDMLDLARLESGTIQLHHRSFMLSELSEKVADKLIYSLQERGLNMMITPINERPVYADPEWIEQVLRNLIVNAIRHAEEQSLIRIEIESNLQSTILHVDNKGIRLTDEQLHQIWERFYRGDTASRSRNHGGTGLGLPIASQILDLHGCRYTVSNLEDGVRFSIMFDDRSTQTAEMIEGA
ncbi:sensor histidine kinase [Paenibacillus kandeliae]|uniref:sensor histidine kinase n=1 Tax=Paenibacillus kandeliae TaxID=3231269 RepID=UPI003458589F